MTRELFQVRKIVSGIEGFLTDPEIDFLYTTAKNLEGTGVIVEIGSWKGKSTACLGRGSLAGSRVKIFAVDPHANSYVHRDFQEEDTFQEFLSNVKNANAESVVMPVRKTSEEAVRGWEGEKIGFLWIDGDHTYPMVKKDLELWWPHVIDGGVVAFHDSTCEGVKQLMNEFLHLQILGLLGSCK